MTIILALSSPGGPLIDTVSQFDFVGASEVLGWLQQQPDTAAADLMDRLIRRYPERYSRRQLRTLQRRVSKWRGVMAKQLVYASAESRGANSEAPARSNLNPRELAA